MRKHVHCGESTVPRADSRAETQAGRTATTTSCRHTLAYGVTQAHFSTPCGCTFAQGVQERELRRASAGGREACALLCAAGCARSRSGLTSILLAFIVQDTAHADTTRSVYPKQRHQTRASRTGVRLQPPTPIADKVGADGADAALYRRDRGSLPPALGRERAGDRAVRSRRGGSVASIAARRA